MERLARLGGVAAVLAALAVPLGAGCESIAGIEDRRLVAGDAGPPEAGPSALCEEYCDTVMRACTGSLSVYSSRTTCLGTCGLLAAGDPLEPVGNNVVCRLRAARNAEAFEPEVNCPRAGPGGAGACGTDCESYCSLLRQACPAKHALIPNCVTACAALRDERRFDVTLDHDGDSLQCRLVHVSSATVDPTTHCDHAQLTPSAPCVDPPAAPPRCTDVCRVIGVACQGDLAQYESTAQCLAVCAALDPGTNADRVEETAACRKYHGYSALFDAPTHCSHSGPTGDGHCGLDDGPNYANCRAYCHLLRMGCPAEFTATFADTDACRIACAGLSDAPKDTKFSVVTAVQGNTVACRTLHVARALAGDASACAAALGAAPCE